MFLTLEVVTMMMMMMIRDEEACTKKIREVKFARYTLHYHFKVFFYASSCIPAYKRGDGCSLV